MKSFLLFSILLIKAAHGQSITDFLCFFRLCPLGTICQLDNWFPTCIEPFRAPELTCDGLFCVGEATCRMVWPARCRTECTPQPYCVEVNNCRNKKCRFNEECVLVETICTRPPCNPAAECRPRSITWPPSDGHCLCSLPGGCAMVRPMECGNENEEACPLQNTCVERNACAVNICREGTECVLHEVECLRHPCNPIAVCETLQIEGTTESVRTNRTTIRLQNNGTTVSLPTNGTTRSG